MQSRYDCIDSKWKARIGIKESHINQIGYLKWDQRAEKIKPSDQIGNRGHHN